METNRKSKIENRKSIWIVAGEASGDARAAEVIRAVHAIDPSVEFVGAGGPKMRPHAAEPFDDWIAEAGVLGLWDVLKRYGYFRQKFDRMLADIARTKPDAVLLVDYPGFNLRLAKALRKAQPQLKILYYVSPQVWAWNRGRIPKMAKWLDLMLCIFPFEKPLYEQSGLKTEFVGHPIVQQMDRDRVPVARDPLLLGLFPGSREREVKRIFPAMVEAARIVAKSRSDIRFEAAAASEAHAQTMRGMAETSRTADAVPIEIRVGTAHELMQRAGAGIVCSGTATLEAACYGLPYALVYKTAWMTYAVGRRLVKVSHLGIVNILAGRTVVREFIQDAATPAALADEALRLLNNDDARAALSAELEAVVSTLHGEGAAERAARAVLEEVGGAARLDTR